MTDSSGDAHAQSVGVLAGQCSSALTVNAGNVEVAENVEQLAGFEAAHVSADEPDAGFDDAVFQEIADRRAQTENADILRRARAL